ncbi:MAG: hypothetical protein ACQETJ_04130 [Bacteroidota bacterium]
MEKRKIDGNEYLRNKIQTIMNYNHKQLNSPSIIRVRQNNRSKLWFIQIISILLLLPQLTIPQEKFSTEGLGFNSVFQNEVQGNFQGKVTGILHLESKDGTSDPFSFAGSEVKLTIVPDTNVIYDVSFKNYSFGNDKLRFRYSTYNRANALSVFINGAEYTTRLIDGACELVLKGLDYKYFDEGNSELLLLAFNKDVGLSPGSCNGEPEIFIKKGSTVAMSISKQNFDYKRGTGYVGFYRTKFIADSLNGVGKEAIPGLIERIDGYERIKIGLAKPILSSMPAYYLKENYAGIYWAYFIEWLLWGRNPQKYDWESYYNEKNLSMTHDLKIAFEYYKYDYNLLVTKSDKQLTYDDMKVVKTIYEKWWEENKHLSMSKLREKYDNDEIWKQSPFAWK